MKLNNLNDGVYYTPEFVVSDCKVYINNYLGEGWESDYTVWDCCCGIGNLTKDINPNIVYNSDFDSNVIQSLNYTSTGSTNFVFDFLDGKDEEIPIKLQNTLENGKLIFLVNPPFITNRSCKNGDVATTKVRKKMKKVNLASGSKNLYTQFIYKIAEYKKKNPNIILAIICPPLFLTGSSYKKFRKYFFEVMGYESGFIFQASVFKNVSGDWGCFFGIFDKPNNNIYEFEVEVKDYLNSIK